jgi:hypothetical protein
MNEFEAAYRLQGMTGAQGRRSADHVRRAALRCVPAPRKRVLRSLLINRKNRTK